MNYYRCFPGDYLSKTVHLTMIQDGAYRRMLDEYYMSEKPLPLDLTLLHAKLRVNTNEERCAVSAILKQFFTETPKGYVNKKAKNELRHSKQRIKAAIKNGKYGGRPKTQQKPTGLQGQFNSLIPNLNLKEEREIHKSVRSWPSDLVLLPAMRDFAVSNGVPDAQAEFEAWRDDCAAHSRKYSNWMAAWRQRCRNHEKFSGGTSGTRQSTTSGATRAEKRVTEADRQSERIFGRTSGLVGDLRPDLSGRPDRTLGAGVPGDAARLASGPAAPILPGSPTGVTRVPAKAGTNLRTGAEPDSEGRA